MNSNLNFPMLIKTENSNIDTFIDFWKRFYEYDSYNDKIYYDNLKPIDELEEDNICELYKWKNGMKLSNKKKDSIQTIINDLPNIKSEFAKSGNSIQELEEIFNYSYNFFKYGYIWNLFFLHILKYEICPIADQYAYRAFDFISNNKYEHSDQSWEKYTKYMEFFNTIASRTKLARKEIDEALWGFGKFLTNYSQVLIDSS